MKKSETSRALANLTLFCKGVLVAESMGMSQRYLVAHDASRVLPSSPPHGPVGGSSDDYNTFWADPPGAHTLADMATNPPPLAERRPSVALRPHQLLDAVASVFEDYPLDCLTPPAARLLQGLQRRVLALVAGASMPCGAEDMRQSGAVVRRDEVHATEIRPPADAFALPVDAYRRPVSVSDIEPLAVRSDEDADNATHGVGRGVEAVPPRRARHGAGQPSAPAMPDGGEPKVDDQATTDTGTLDPSAPPGNGRDADEDAAASPVMPTPRRWVFEAEPPAFDRDADDPVRSALRDSAIAAVLRMRAAASHFGGGPIVPDASTEPLPWQDSVASRSATSPPTDGLSSSRNESAGRMPSSVGGIRPPAPAARPAWVSRPGMPTGAALQNMSRGSEQRPTA